MTFYMIGLGLGDKNDITLSGLEAIKKCDTIYLEYYTSILPTPIEELEKFYDKKINLATREMVEKDSDKILKDNTAFLVVGDVFSATTHSDLYLRAKEKKLDVKIIHNTSIINAVSCTGLELYKFGKTTSIVFDDDNWLPDTPYKVLDMNKKNGLHTLFLLDIKINEDSKENIKKDISTENKPRFMTVNKGIEILKKLEDKNKKKLISENTMIIGLARIGQDSQKIVYGKIKELLKIDFGSPLHCIIVPGSLHFMEEDFLKQYKK